MVFLKPKNMPYKSIVQQLRTFAPVLLWMFSTSVACQTLQQNSSMKKQEIRFIPETFNQIELGHLANGQNPCSPLYPKDATDLLWNEILINAPQKIILSPTIHADSIPLIFPVCIASVITARRGAKYAALYDERFQIRELSTGHQYTAKIFDETLLDGNPIATPPWKEESDIEKKQRIADAQRYSDSELDEGFANGEYLNLNLLNYINIQLKPGIYEIYYSVAGLESNKVQVEIVFEE